MEDVEAYERMCKKLAQLTRVVFILNTKNDENDAIVESVISAYEMELDNITKEANQVINQLKKNIEKLRDSNNIEDKLTIINQKFEDCSNKYVQDYENYKQLVQKREKAFFEEFEQKMEKATKDMIEMRNSYELKYVDMIKKHDNEKKLIMKDKDSLKSNLSTDFEKLKKKSEDDLERLKSEYLIKENKLKSDHSKEKETYLNDYENQIKSLKQTIYENAKKGNKYSEDLKSTLEKQIEFLKGEKESLLKNNDKLNAEILEFKEKISSLMKEIELRDKEILSLKEKLSSLEKTLNEISLSSSNDKNDKMQLSEETKNLKTMNESFLKEINIKNNEIKKLNEEIKSISEKMTNLESESKKNKAITNQLIENLKNDLNNKNKAISEIENEIIFYKEENKELKVKLTKLEKDYQIIKDKYLTEIDKLKLTSQSESTNLTKLLEEQEKNFMDRLKVKDDETKEKIANLEKDNENKTLSMRLSLEEKHKGELELLNITKENLLKEKDKEIELIKATYEKQLKEKELKIEELNNKISELSLKSGESSQSYEKTLENLNNQIKDKAIQIDYLLKEKEILKLENGNLTKKIEGYTIEISDLNKKIVDSFNKTKELEEQLKSKLNDSLSGLKAQYEEKITNLTNKHQEEINKLNNSRKSAIDENKDNYEKMIITLKQEIADLKLQIDKIRKEYESELTNKNSNSKNEFDNLKKSYQDKEQGLIDTYELKIKSLIDQHNENINNLNIKLNQDKEKDLNDLEKKLEKKYSDEISKLTSDSKGYIDNKIKEFEEKLRLKSEENNQLIKLVDSERNDYARKSSNYEKQLKDSGENVKRLQDEISLLKNQLNILENEFSNNKVLHKNTHDELREKYNQMDQDHKDNIKSIQNSFLTKSEEFRRTHLEEMQKIRLEFGESVKILEQKNAMLNTKYQELMDIFVDRPSKEEDLELINKLKEENILKDTSLKRAEENMEYYKNLLINSEETYNKYFGNNPKVGGNPNANPTKKPELNKQTSIKNNDKPKFGTSKDNPILNPLGKK